MITQDIINNDATRIPKVELPSRASSRTKPQKPMRRTFLSPELLRYELSLRLIATIGTRMSRRQNDVRAIFSRDYHQNAQVLTRTQAFKGIFGWAQKIEGEKDKGKAHMIPCAFKIPAKSGTEIGNTAQ